MTTAKSAFSVSLKVAVTAPEPTFSISAATEDAWQRRVQWSTLLWPKAVRVSFGKRYASSFEHLALPKPAIALPPYQALRSLKPAAALSSASSQVASRKWVQGSEGSTSSAFGGASSRRIRGFVRRWGWRT